MIDHYSDMHELEVAFLYINFTHIFTPNKVPKAPSVLFMHNTSFSAPFTLIGFINREKLYCTSEDLFESFQDETTYCTAAGT